jgi:F-type H+-transporting ATPase subunit delta
MISEVSKRYAKALFDYAQDGKKLDLVTAQLSQLSSALEGDESVREFIGSPVVTGAEKMSALKAALGPQISEEILNLTGLLMEKNRLDLLSQVAQAFTLIADESKGVTRGTVKSASALNEDARRKIEGTVAEITKKRVILNYEEDKTIMGGLVAQVGGWTFDDSLQSHLVRLSEELNRRV